MWSDELPFIRREIIGVPGSPGVYEILQSATYPRYKGETRVLKIGMSERSLRDELVRHLGQHTAANRLHRIQGGCGVELSVRYNVCPPQDARAAEGMLLRAFEDAHWDLPLLNDQRGYRRGTDRHFR